VTRLTGRSAASQVASRTPAARCATLICGKSRQAEAEHVIVSTLARVPSGMGQFIRSGAAFDDVPTHVLPVLADSLDAQSAGFYQVIRRGNAVRLGHHGAHRMKPESQHLWRQQFRCLSPVGTAAPIPSGTGQAFPLDEWIDFPEYLRSSAYETFWGPLGIHHVLFGRLAHSNTESFVFGFHRSAGERRFSDADVAMVASLLPLLGSALTSLRPADVAERRRGQAAAVPAFAELTCREREIATDVAEGLANKHIARRRGVSVHTVENHLRSIFRKTGVDSRTKLALAAGIDGPYSVPA
jgi:DNA-binding CsgD family transcriptional regulator